MTNTSCISGTRFPVQHHQPSPHSTKNLIGEWSEGRLWTQVARLGAARALGRGALRHRASGVPERLPDGGLQVEDPSPFLISDSMRRSGTSHSSATATYTAIASHGRTKASATALRYIPRDSLPLRSLPTAAASREVRPLVAMI